MSAAVLCGLTSNVQRTKKRKQQQQQKESADSTHDKDEKQDRSTSSTTDQRPPFMSLPSSPDLSPSLPSLSPVDPLLPLDAGSASAGSLIPVPASSAAAASSSPLSLQLLAAAAPIKSDSTADPEKQLILATTTAKTRKRKGRVVLARPTKGKTKQKRVPKQLQNFQIDRKTVLLEQMRADAAKVASRLPTMWLPASVQSEFQQQPHDAETLSTTLAFIPGQPCGFDSAVAASQVYIQQSAFGRKIDLRTRFACGRCARPFNSYAGGPSREHSSAHVDKPQGPRRTWTLTPSVAQYCMWRPTLSVPKSISRCFAMPFHRCWLLS